MMLRVLTLCYLLTILSCSNQKLLFDNAICFENINIIDPEMGLKTNQTVVIQGDKIIKVAPTESLLLAKENTIVNSSNKFLIPGLWDTHVHFSFIEELAPKMFDLFLAYGVTSVRDTGGEIEFVNKWKKKSIENPETAPRVMVSGPLLDGKPNVYDGSDAGHPPLSVGLNTTDEVLQELISLHEADVDFFKAYEMLSPEQFSVIADFAKEKGLRVTGHVPLSMSVIQASNAGLSSMEHLRNLELACASNADQLLEMRQKLLREGKSDLGHILRSRIHMAQRKVAIENYDENQADKVLNVLAQNDTWQVPTLALSTGSTERGFATSEWQESFRYLPNTIEKRWKQNIDSYLERDITDFKLTYSQWLLDITKKIHDKGIVIMAGTDCPIFFLTPGHSLHQELIMLRRAGLSPLEVIKSATLYPAQYFGMENELGKISEGYIADMIVLDANPLEEIANTKRINAVIKNGKYFDRNQLDAILDRLDNN